MNSGMWLALLAGVPVTLALTVGGFALGALLGLPVMWLRTSRIAPLRWIARAYIELGRGIPPIVWLFLIYNVPPQLDPALAQTFTPMRSGIIGLGLIAGAYMAEIYRGCLSAIKNGQWEAAHALGMSKVDTAVRVIGPQMFRVAIPAAATYAIGLLKDSSVAYTISNVDIMGQAASQFAQTNSMLPYLLAAVLYLALTFPAAWLSRWVDARLRRRVAR